MSNEEVLNKFWNNKEGYTYNQNVCWNLLEIMGKENLKNLTGAEHIEGKASRETESNLLNGFVWMDSRTKRNSVVKGQKQEIRVSHDRPRLERIRHIK